MTLQLAFQSIGVVFGDLGTSPLYVLPSTFANGIKDNEDLLGVLSLIYYTLTLLPMIKYIVIVLRANDNGEGGTFALYSLICRYAKVGMIPNQQAEDENVSNYRLELPSSNRTKIASKIKSSLENSTFAKYMLLIATMVGTSMVIGDGVLTPCISVLSAMEGIMQATPAMTRGAEAFFADIGHFSVRAIRLSTCTIVYPSIILCYSGQASYLRKHMDHGPNAFYASVPDPLYWPMFVIAVMAAIIASQALISGAFSIIQQSLAMGCFPNVKVVHTSAKVSGQVYIPEINYILMLFCIVVTFCFKTSAAIGNAYGIAVVFVMTLTSFFMVIVMLMIWKTNVFLVIGYILVFVTIELVYLSSLLFKFKDGGYLPLAFAVVLMCIMYTWNDVNRRKYYYELENKMSPEMVQDIIGSTNVCNVPGLAIFYSDLVDGIPPIFKHYIENVHALHYVLVFVCIKSLPISKVPVEDRFLFNRIGSKEFNVYRCVVRYGYTDLRSEHESFEIVLVRRLREFVADEILVSQENLQSGESDELIRTNNVIDQAVDAGIVHFIGEREVIAHKESNISKKFLINYGYNFLVKNLRQQTSKVFDVPHQRMVKVGMIYEL
ncbi:potassium transporter 5-like isoform X2 [Arachis hypogaea]|uniref:potassium transporter 5-like isoform X2 n=1 Tax=Arachis hypogaea TaxID=3818 RepID=UPI003B20E37F